MLKCRGNMVLATIWFNAHPASTSVEPQSVKSDTRSDMGVTLCDARISFSFIRDTRSETDVTFCEARHSFSFARVTRSETDVTSCEARHSFSFAHVTRSEADVTFSFGHDARSDSGAGYSSL